MRYLLMLISLDLFISCQFEPPGFEESSGENKFYVRTIEMSCTSDLTICADQTARDLAAKSFYTSDDCENISDSSPVIALGSSKLLCNSDSCFSKIKDFVNGDTPVNSLPTGTYSLVSFIDVNENSLPDSDEPYLCAHDVQISALKNNTILNVVLIQTRAEAIL